MRAQCNWKDTLYVHKNCDFLFEQHVFDLHFADLKYPGLIN